MTSEERAMIQQAFDAYRLAERVTRKIDPQGDHIERAWQNVVETSKCFGWNPARDKPLVIWLDENQIGDTP